MKRIGQFFLICICLFSQVACEPEEDDYEELFMSETFLEMKVGETKKILIVNETAEEVIVKGTWKTSNSEIASVDNGTINAIASGKVTISFTCDDMVLKCEVTVDSVTIEEVENKILDSERKFTGTLVNGIPEGSGELTWILTNCVYSGEFKNGKYEGEGIFKWLNNGDSLEGTFKNGNPVKGTYIYANTMKYIGGFNDNWQFHGEGSFDWNTYNSDGTVKSYGWLYEGKFNNGSPNGCYGKVTFNVAREKSNINDTADGIYYFEGYMDGFPSIKRNQHGFGKIVFQDKTVYEGDIYYDNNGSYIRFGQGTQYFINSSNYTGASVGGNINDKLYCYIGEFDGINRSWIYGNGVMYICDKNSVPVAYIKGQWNGMTRIGQWNGEFSTDDLLEEYRDIEEIPFVDGYFSTLNGLINLHKNDVLTDKTLLIGDSHFTMWYDKAQTDLAPELDVINFGIGGTTAFFWDKYLSELEKFTSQPKNILVRVGGNDITIGSTVNETKKYCMSVVTRLSKMFPETKIIYVSMFDAPAKWNDGRNQKQKEVNLHVKNTILENPVDNVYYMDIAEFVYDKTATSGKYYDSTLGKLRTEFFLSDNIHLNDLGYQDFAKALKNGMNNLMN